MSSHLLLRSVMSATISAKKAMLNSSCLLIVCRGFIFYLCYLYLFTYTRFPYQTIFVSFSSNMGDVTHGAGNANFSGASEFAIGFSEVCVARSFVLCVLFCRSLFVLFLFAIVLSVLFSFIASD